MIGYKNLIDLLEEVKLTLSEKDIEYIYFLLIEIAENKGS